MEADKDSGNVIQGPWGSGEHADDLPAEFAAKAHEAGLHVIDMVSMKPAHTLLLLEEWVAAIKHDYPELATNKTDGSAA